MRAPLWILPACLLLALVACGSDEPAATPDAGAGTTKADPDDDNAGRPPALAKGLRSPEALAVDALTGAHAVRVLRLEPASAQPDCRTGRCMQGNLIESGLLLRGDDAGSAASVVRAWLLESDSVDTTCDPEFRQAVAFNSGGSEYALLMDRECGAYQLVVDGRIRGRGVVETPDEDPVAQLLLGGMVGGGDAEPDANDGADDGEAAEPPADAPAGDGEAAPDPEGESEGESESGTQDVTATT